MIQISSREHSAKKRAVYLFLAIFSCFLVSGCSLRNQESHSKTTPSEDRNIKTVQTILENEFTVPDKEYLRLRKDAGVLSKDLSKAELEKVKTNYEKIDAYVRSIYEPYFTENGLDKFLTYQFHRAGYEYQLSVDEVKQAKNDTYRNHYFFTMHVAFESPNEEKTLYEVNGKAIFSKNGKIEDMVIGDKESIANEQIEHA